LEFYIIEALHTDSDLQKPKVVGACGTGTASLQHGFNGQKIEFSLTSPVPIASGVSVVWFNQAITGTPTPTPANFLFTV